MDIEKMVQDTFNNYHKSVVLIVKRTAEVVSNSASLGFVIGRKDTTYLVMTCRHCVTAPSNPSDLRLSVRIPGEAQEYEVEKLYDDLVNDLAIIKVMNVPEAVKCPILQFGNSEDMPLNTPIVQVGYVLSSIHVLTLEPSASPGTIIKMQNAHKGTRDVIYWSSTRHGFSGSPLLLDFKVIGVLYAMSFTGQTAFARSSNTVATVLRNWLGIAPHDTRTIEEMIQLIYLNI